MAPEGQVSKFKGDHLLQKDIKGCSIWSLGGHSDHSYKCAVFTLHSIMTSANAKQYQDCHRDRESLCSTSIGQIEFLVLG